MREGGRRIYVVKSVDDIKESVCFFSSSLFAAAFASYYVDRTVNARSHMSASAEIRRIKTLMSPHENVSCELLDTEKKKIVRHVDRTFVSHTYECDFHM